MAEQDSVTTGQGRLTSLRTPTDLLDVDPSGVLLLDGCSAADLVAAFGSPLFVIAEGTLRANYRRIYRAFSGLWPSEVTVMYAIKANNNLAVRAILHHEGAGGDCFGESELYATFLAGADPSTVVLNGSNKSVEHLRTGARLGVSVNVDSEEELETISQIARDEKLGVRVSIRLALVPDEFDPAGKIRAFQWGVSMPTAKVLTKRALAADGVLLEGYHLHLGRQSPDPEFFRAWGRLLGEALAELYEATGFAPQYLNIGGGYPRERDVESGDDVAYGMPCRVENQFPVEEYAARIVQSVLGALRQRDLNPPRLRLEPGRYIAGNAGILLTTAGTIKNDAGNTWVNVDASLNNLMMRETRNYEYIVLPASRMNEQETVTAFVTGPLCLGKPLARGANLPPLRRGDLLAFLDAGMYAETMSAQMNGVPRPATVLVNAGQADLIKTRESVLDVFSRHRIPERLLTAGLPNGAPLFTP